MLTGILNRVVKQASPEPDRLEKRDGADRAPVQELYVSSATEARVADRVAEITKNLRAQITEELRVQFNAELEARVASLQSQYEHRAEPGSPNGLGEEIAATQAELLKKERELAKSLSDDTSLGAISRLRSETRELAAYLKGLNFSGKIALDRP